MMTGTTLIFFAIMILKQIQLNHSMPSIGVRGTDIWDIREDDTPSHVRPIRLYSKQGHYVAITADGDVTATRNQSSEDGKLFLWILFTFDLKFRKIFTIQYQINALKYLRLGTSMVFKIFNEMNFHANYTQWDRHYIFKRKRTDNTNYAKILK